MLRATRSVIPAEAGTHCPADPTAPGVDYPAHSYDRAITARPERRAWTML